MIDAARAAAVELLRQVEDDDAYANLALAALLRARGLSGRDAAFATELAYGTLRWQGLYDAILATCVTGDPARVEPAIRRVLRLGCHQLLAMRVPPHAAVSATAALVPRQGQRTAARTGFVNAVLRSVDRRDLPGWIAELGLDGQGSVEVLATRWSHPAWIVRAFLDALGEHREQIGELLAADNESARPALVARPGRMSIDDLLAEPGVDPGRWSGLAGILRQGSPEALACIRSGAAAVQDEGSQLVTLALARATVASTEGAWLDACAGPGGKAGLLAGLAQQAGAQLVAVEAHAHRAELVRTAVPGHQVLHADARTRPWGARQFDRVLVDAPCTGIGALRRRPEARWRRSPTDLATLGPLQRSLLTAGLEATAPGGVVAYVTCSPHLAETEAVVRDVAGRAPGLTLVDARELIPEVPDCGTGPFVQLWPHRHGTDAMFMALLRRDVHGAVTA